MRILIVEDDITIASYLKKGLEEESFSVDVAYDGVDGLTFVREKNYAVMVIDWMLPKLSGPFSFDELVARIRALIRRQKLQKDTILKAGNLAFNISKRKVSRDDKEIELTIKEYELLEILMINKGHVVSVKKIISSLWGEESVSSNIITVLIHHLRNKIDDFHARKLIKTVRKLGYKIDDI